MARQSFRERYPYAGLFIVIALVLAVPITVFSVQNVSTQTAQYAQVMTTPTPTPRPITTPTPTPYPYCTTTMIRDCFYGCSPTLSGGVCKSAPTPTSCSKAPSWSNSLGHTDGATSVKFKYSVKNNCEDGKNVILSASRPTTGWSYQYSGCSVNTKCTFYIPGGGSTTVYVTISRPTNANLGTYNITLKAALATNTSIYSTKNAVYVVTK